MLLLALEPLGGETPRTAFYIHLIIPQKIHQFAQELND